MHERSMKEGTCPHRRRTPSFSSSLLDSIYRSIDESKSNLHVDQQLGLHDRTTHNFSSEKSGKKERMNLRRAVMLEDWMDKHSSHSLNSQLLNSSSSSSECSSGGIFSSSETDSTTFKKQRPRPTSEKKKHDHRTSEKQNNPQTQREGGFARTKLRALKIYGELNQRVKQPISPGSRIASFLSSIFNSQNVKKAKMCYVGAVEDVSFEHKSKSPCFSSTPSSFSRRSCMSKTPSSAKKSNNGVKRSVRFYPVSVILGEDSEPQSSHNIYETEPNLSVRKITRSSSIKELKKNTVRGKENGSEEAAARDFVKGYRNSGKGEFNFRGFYGNGENEDDDDDDEDEDDDVSCSSSDLFELDHLIGAARYQGELPFYETTNWETNKAIASGLCL